MRIDTRKEVNTSEKREDMVEEEFVKEQDYYEKRESCLGKKKFMKEKVKESMKEKIAKDRKVIPDPIDDRKFQE